MATNEEALDAFKILTKWFHKNRRKANVLIIVILGGWNGVNSNLIFQDEPTQNNGVELTEEELRQLIDQASQNGRNIYHNHKRLMLLEKVNDLIVHDDFQN